MDKTLYELMDWAGIEEIVYSEAADPHQLLGPLCNESRAFDSGIYSYSNGHYGKRDKERQALSVWSSWMLRDFLQYLAGENKSYLYLSGYL